MKVDICYRVEFEPNFIDALIHYHDDDDDDEWEASDEEIAEFFVNNGIDERVAS